LIVTVAALPADSETFTEESLNVFAPCFGFFFDAASVTVPLTVPFAAWLQVAVAVNVPAFLTGLACFFFLDGGRTTVVDFSFSVHVNFDGCDFVLNVAVTDVVAEIVTEHVPVPEQPPPDHPAKVEPDAGAAVSVAICPEVNDAEHVLGHVIPGPVTLPDPVPALSTVSVNVGGGATPIAALPKSSTAAHSWEEAHEIALI
jgi:hypothetical protein